MHSLVSFNREIIPAKDASMSPVSVSGLYGKGVFTTLAVIDGEPFLFDKHWDRLENNAGRLGIGFDGLTEGILRESLLELLDANSVNTGRCRVTLFDSSSSKIWLAVTDKSSSVLIQSASPRQVPDSLRLNVSPFVVSSTAPLNNIKSCNYLEQTVSYDAAHSAGFDEAVRVNEDGFVVSACMANLFWITDGKLFTPLIDMGCLAGTTRGFIAERVEVNAGYLRLHELGSADCVFLTSAGLGLAQVASITGDGFRHEFGELPASVIEEHGLEQLTRISGS